MDRRRFLVTSLAGVLAAPLSVEAQRAAKMPRIVFIFNSIPESEITGSQPRDRYATAFLVGLREFGWIDGQNIIVERRSAEGRPERFAALARESVGLHVDLIVVSGTPRALEVRQLSPTIPIVMAGGGADGAIQAGLAKSLARPGGTVTGVTTVTGSEFDPKRLQLLKEAVPKLSRVAYLGATAPLKPHIEAAARAMSLTLLPVEVAGEEGFDAAFAAIRRQRVDAVCVTDATFLWGRRRRIIEFVAQERLPTVYWDRVFAESEGLMSYGSDYADIVRRAAAYVDRILKGANPGDLPIEQPTKFELVINLKTAKAIGLTIPPSLLQRADQVIE